MIPCMGGFPEQIRGNIDPKIVWALLTRAPRKRTPQLIETAVLKPRVLILLVLEPYWSKVLKCRVLRPRGFYIRNRNYGFG